MREVVEYITLAIVSIDKTSKLILIPIGKKPQCYTWYSNFGQSQYFKNQTQVNCTSQGFSIF